MLCGRTVQYSTVQYSTVQYSTVQYSTVQYSTVQYDILSDIMVYSTMSECVTVATGRSFMEINSFCHLLTVTLTYVMESIISYE